MSRLSPAFHSLSGFVVRHWILVIVAWLVVAAGLKQVAPRWNDVTLDGDLQHLPSEMPSVRGGKLLREAFPENKAQSQIVVAVVRTDGPLTHDDFAFANRIAESFQARKDFARDEGGLPLLDVWTHATPVVGRKLKSRDKQAMLVVLQLENEFMATDNVRVLSVVKQELDLWRDALPEGVEIGITGSAAIGGDMLTAAAESISNTEKFTVVLVVIILLLVYRAPLLVVVPMAAIAVSVSVAIDLVAIVTQFDRLPGMEWWNFSVFKTTKIFVVVILYGAGTDYCLFLISRFKEELAAGHDRARAVALALGNVGEALTASALTTVLGLGMMFFADFGKFRNSGPAIGLCLMVALAACMTLAPAIMLAFGRFVFWPFGIPGPQAGGPSGRAPQVGSLMSGFWDRLSRAILARPGLILVTSLLLLAPLAVGGLSVEITYDLLGELESSRPSVEGTELLRKHFPHGETGPLTVLALKESGGFDTPTGEREIALLTKYLYNLPGLAERGRGVTSVRSLAEPMGDRPGFVQPFTREGMEKIVAKRHPLTKARFVTPVPEFEGRVARFDLVLAYDPFSADSIRMLEKVEEALLRYRAGEGGKSHWSDVQFDLIGTTAGIRDLKEVTTSDRRLIQQLVVVAVLTVLLLILRHPVVCVYLIISVLFSYFVAIGATELFFQWSYGDTYHGIDWKVPIYLFVILIAIGEDYNIYLTTRVFEEQRLRGPREGLHEATVRTGGIITSCGIIMAGTFVSMTTGSLRGMTELGFALSLGVLLDTFVVRPVLVPAFLALLTRFQVEKPHSQPIEQPAEQLAPQGTHPSDPGRMRV